MSCGNAARLLLVATALVASLYCLPASAAAAPTLTVNSPAEGAALNEGATVVDGIVTVDSGVSGWPGVYPYLALCSVPGQLYYSTCGALGGLGSGPQTLQVVLLNVQTGSPVTTKTVNFSVADTTAPSVRSLSQPEGSTITNANARIFVNATGDASSLVAPGLDCDAPFSYTENQSGGPVVVSAFGCDLNEAPDGPLAINYTLADRSGNERTGTFNWTVSDPDEVSFRIGFPVAEVTVISSTIRPVGSYDRGHGYGSQNWSTNGDGVQARCSVDGGAPSFEKCLLLEHLSNGLHTFSVSLWHVELDEQIGDAETSTFLVEDDAEPAVLSTDPAAGATIESSGRTIGIRVSADSTSLDSDELSCSTDDFIHAEVTPEYTRDYKNFNCTLTGPSNGPLNVDYELADWTGNVSTGTFSWTFNDVVAPEIAITQPQDGSTVTTDQVQIAYEVYESSDVSCALDGAAIDCQDYVDMYGYVRGFFTKPLRAGAHIFAVTAEDSLGNSTTATSNFNVEPAAASALNPFTIDVPRDGASYPTSAIAISGKIFERYAGTSKYPFCSIDGAAWTYCEAAIPLQPGAHELHTKLVSGWQSTDPTIAGSERTIHFTTTADTTGPTVSTSTPDGQAFNDSSTAIFLSASVDTQSLTASGFTCDPPYYSTSWIGDYGTATARGFTCRPAQITNGPRTVVFTATDHSGNTGTLTRNWTYSDLAPPTVAINSPANGSTKEARFTNFNVSVSGYTEINCTFDGLPESCSGGFVYSRTLPYGSHTLTISATDAVGNSTTATSTFSIADNTPPSLTISSPANGQSFGSPFWVYYSSSDTSGEQIDTSCKVDSASWQYCSSTSSRVTGFGFGTHEFSVRVRDLAGNETIRSISFDVSDQTPPAIAFVGLHGSTFDTTNVPNATFTNNDPDASLRCTIDGSANLCDAWDDEFAFYEPLTNGSHTVSLTATDWAGNQSVATATFTVDDHTAPSITLVSPAPGAALTDGTNVSAIFEVVADEPARLSCSLDGAPFVVRGYSVDRCNYPSLVNGPHTVSAKSEDAAGNASTAGVSFTVNDTTGPTIVITSPASPPYTFSSEPRFYFTVTGAVDVERCRFDDEPYTDCYGGHTGWDLSQGAHTFTVTATDGAGNPTTLTVPLTYIDDVPPEIWINTPEDGSTLSSSPIAALSLSGVGIYEWENAIRCTVDGRPLGPRCSSNYVWESLGNGTHTLKLWATDRYGNTTTDESDFTINDVTNSAATITYPANGQMVTDSGQSFTFSTGIEPRGWYCRLDKRAWTACSYSYAPARMGNGTHTFTIEKRDNGERVSSASSTFTVADNTPPALTITNPSDGEVFDEGGYVYVDVQPYSYQLNSTTECYLDDVRLDYCSFYANEVGEHALRVVRRDPAGNTSEATVLFEIAEEGDPPTPQPTNLAVSEPIAGSTVPVSPMVRYTTTRPAVARLYGWIDDEEKQRLRINSTGWRPAAMREGPHTIHMEAIGNDGAVESVSIPVVVDDADPTLVDITSPADGATVTRAPARLRFNTGSDVTNSECRIDDGAWATCNPFYSLVPKELTNGSHTFSVRVTDFGGHQASDSVSFVLSDTTAPEFQITSPIEGATISSAPRLGLSVEKGEGYSVVSCKVNGVALADGDEGDCAKNEILSGLVPGANQLEVKMTDVVGNASTRVMNFTVQAPEPPVVQIVRPTEGTVFTDSSMVAGYWFARHFPAVGPPVEDYDIPVQCSADGAPWSSACPPARSFAAPGLPTETYRSLNATNGAHSLAIRALDFLGNATGTAVNYSVDDHAAPELELDVPAEGVTYPSGEVFIDADYAGVLTFECSLDDELDYSPCSDHDQIGEWSGPDPLSGGSHILRLRVSDPAGNTTDFTRVFTVGGAAVDTQFTSGPSGRTQDPTPTFEFTISPLGTPTQCRVDSSNWASATSPFTTSTLTEGSHSVECRGVNLGVPESTPARRTILVDTIPPQTTIPTGPTTATRNPQPTFGLASSEPDSQFKCTVDSGDEFTTGAALELTSQVEGDHTLSCAAVDLAGNVDQSPATRAFVIDLTAPETSITGSPPAYVKDNTPTFSLSSTEPGSLFECRVDGGAWIGSQSADFTTSTLADGVYAIDCRAIDFAGNADATPATHSFTVDTIAPSTAVDSPPVTPTRQRNASFLLSASESVRSYSCNLVGALSQGVIGSQFHVAGFYDGVHHIRCKATDLAGNVDPVGTDTVHDVDATPPSVTFVAPAVGSGQYVQILPHTFTFSISDAHSVDAECWVDDDAASPCTDHFDAGPLADGTHSFNVHATDEVGNERNASIELVQDSTPPETTYLGGIPAISRATSAGVGFGSTELLGRLHCRTNGGAWSYVDASPSPPMSTAVFGISGLTTGDYLVECAAVDKSGNEDPTPAFVAFEIDHVAPSIIVTAPTPAQILGSSSLTANFSIADSDVAAVQCRIDNASAIDCVSPKQFTGLAEGAHTFKIVATDNVGNVRNVEVGFVVDTAPPTTSFVSVPSASSEDATPTAELSSNESGVTFECRVDSGAWQSVSGASFTAAPVQNGPHTIDCRARDAASNYDPSPESTSFVVDAQAPVVAIDATLDGSTFGDPTPTISFTATDALPMTVRCRIDDIDESACQSPVTIPRQTDGAHSFAVIATDSAGNVSMAIAHFTILTPEVIAKAGDDIQIERGQEIEFDAGSSEPFGLIDSYRWEFPDQSTKTTERASYTFTDLGVSQVKLTIDANGHLSSDFVKVTVIDPPVSPGPTVTVRAGSNPLQGAAVTVSTPSGARVTATSNGSGRAVLRGLDDGKYTGYALLQGYRPASFKLNVLNGGGDAEVSLVQGDITVSTIEHRPLTYEEIIEAGIDVDDPANQQVIKFEVWLKINGVNYRESYYGWSSFGGSSSGHSWAGGECERVNFEYLNCGGHGVTMLHEPDSPNGTFLVIPFKATFLKEFFEVTMVTTNALDESFTLNPGAATLTLPRGLSLAPTTNRQSLSIATPAINGGESTKSTWIVRGDEAGEYEIAADYRATSNVPGLNANTHAVSAKPLKVWGTSAIGLVVDADDEAVRHHPYRVKFGLKNVSDVPVYNPSIELETNGSNNYIVQPREIYEHHTDEIAPGETYWAGTVTVIPTISGDLDLGGSFIVRTNGVAGDADEILSHPREESRAFHAYSRGSKTVLRWDETPGATEYKVFSTESDTTPFGNAALPLTLGPADSPSGRTAVISGPVPSTRFYAVSPMVDGEPKMDHPMVNAEPAGFDQQLGAVVESGLCKPAGQTALLSLRFSDPLISLADYQGLTINGKAVSPGSGALSGHADTRVFTYTSEGNAKNKVSVTVRNSEGESKTITAGCDESAPGESDTGGSGPTADPNCANPQLTIGKAVVKATCWTRKGSSSAWTASGKVRVAGVDVISPTVTVDTKALTIKTSGATVVEIAGIVLYEKPLDWKLDNPISFDSSKKGTIRGLPLEGSAKISFGINQATIDLKAKLPPKLGGLSGELSLVVTNDNGLKIDSLRFSVTGLNIGKLKSGKATFTYERRPGGEMWTAELQTELPAVPKPITVSGKLEILNGSFKSLRIDVKDLNKHIYAGVFLQDLGLGVAVNPFSISGSIGLTAGPKIKSYAAIKIYGSGSITIGPDASIYKISGNITVVTKEMASAQVTYSTRDGLTFDGKLKQVVPAGFLIDASVDGWVAGESAFMANGRGELYWGPYQKLHANAQAIVSNRGFGGCAGFKGSHVGFNYYWEDERVDTFAGACDIDQLRTSRPRIAATGETTFDIRPGDSVAVVKIRGNGGVPHVKLVSPSGEVIDGPVPDDVVSNAQMMLVPVASESALFAILSKPRVGTWRVQPFEDSVPVATAQAAGPLPDVSVRGSVKRRGNSTRFNWKLKPISGQSVSFFARGAGESKLIKKTNSASGSVSVKSAAIGGTVQIDAIVNQRGMPRKVVHVAKFTAPKLRLKKPSKLKASVTRKSVTLKWSKVVGAARYEIEFWAPDGRHSITRVKGSKKSMKFTSSAKKGKYRFAIRAIDSYGFNGPLASLRR